MQLGKPVKWIETRRENMQATIHGRGQVGYIEIGCKNDGTITGLRYNVFADLGAYHQLLTPAIPTLTGLMLSGAYKIPAIQMNITACFTNKMATDAYRGAGRPEATYVVERAMDLVAAELGMDPVEVRRKNFPATDEFPFPHRDRTGLRQRQLSRRTRQGSGDRRLRKTAREQKKAAREGRMIGIGVSTYVEICALGPSQAMPAGGWESATVRIEPTGKVTVTDRRFTARTRRRRLRSRKSPPMNWASISNDVTVIHGDTAIVQYGIGTFGSRATAVGGTAVFIAIQKLKEKATKIAAHMLQADISSVSFQEGTILERSSRSGSGSRNFRTGRAGR